MQDISKILLTFVEFFLHYVWIANLFFIIVIIMIEKKNPLYTIFWIFLLTVIPYFGFEGCPIDIVFNKKNEGY